MKIKPAPEAKSREIYALIRPISLTNLSEQHRTVLYVDGSAHCTCEGFRYREDCRHLTFLRRHYVVTKDGFALEGVAI